MGTKRCAIMRPSRQSAAEHAAPAASRASRHRPRQLDNSALDNLAGIVEVETGCARMQFLRIPKTEITKEIGLDPSVGEKFAVNFIGVKAAHGPAVRRIIGTRCSA